MKIALKILTAALLVSVITGCVGNATKVKILWVSSDQNIRWHTRTIEAVTNNRTPESDIQVFTDTVYQDIDGFGACFNELGWEALNSLPVESRQEIIESLFDTVSGCGLNICRIPIGANDYALDWYSHNEVEKDFEMNEFSVERDMERLIPYIKSAKSLNPEIRIWASPWCPPSWMKTNHHYACRPDKVNDLPEEGRGEELVTQFIMEEEYLHAYALYFSRFIQAYKENGIEIYAIHVQNEPNSCQNFPSCIWNPADLAVFIGEYLGPVLRDSNPDTQVWLGTIERPQIERVDVILQNDRAKEFITGVGFQWAGKDAIPFVHSKYPDLRLMQTETECGNGSNDWEAAEYTFGLMKHYFGNGANSYMFWNMILDETGKSQWGWKQNSMITVNRDSGTFAYNPEFYLMKHFSSFIKPGSVYMKTTDRNCLAFRNSEEIILICYNEESIIVENEFVIDNFKFMASLTPRSFNTFVIEY